ncbi:hypothetical protein [Desulfovibrio falkowii]|uniref:Phage tail protein n=1 Tax=Desulfovibrio falkowii TaxID=3136602 RepID=A0ABQ0E946_9BACT
MATAIWPLVLPQAPQRSNWKNKIPNNQLRSDMDAGTEKVRRKGGDNQFVVDVTYVLKKEQILQLRAFVKDTLRDSVLCFDWPEPIEGKMVRAEIKGGTESLYNESLWGNTNAFQITLIIGYWPDAPLT